ncbi:MAG: hypothetical protein OEL69_02170 [Nitrosopumilus sp.]|nr:hypothetical protein [Nitrosopumilus sp.]
MKIKTIFLVFIIPIIILAIPTNTFAIEYVEPLSKIQNPFPKNMTSDGFGWSVAIDDNDILIGAPGDIYSDWPQKLPGSVYFWDFPFPAGIENEVMTFTNPTPYAGDWFGYSVTISDNNILVGAPRDNSDTGSVYLFDTSGNLLQTFENPTPDSGELFGYSVAISGNNILVGAPEDFITDTPEETRSVYLFHTPGNNILVGAAEFSNVENFTDDTGSVYLFDTSGNLLQTFENPTPDSGELFGYSVAISGNNILVGAPGDNSDTGSVYLFDTSGNLLQTFENPTPDSGELFGLSVAISGNNILVGAAEFSNVENFTDDTGSVYLFDTSGNLLQTFENPTPDSGELFGLRVAISGNNILVGAPNNSDTGSVYLFDTSGNLLQTFENPTPDSGELFGSGVAISDNNWIVIGAIGYQSSAAAYFTMEDQENGCLIATAAFGSEMAPQVQFLREIRDNTIMSTMSGTVFMTGFNQIYYSFSPTIAEWERENSTFRESVKIFITPMISTLSIMSLAENGSEIEVLGLGLLVIALNLGMYIATPVAVAFTTSKYLKSRK